VGFVEAHCQLAEEVRRTRKDECFCNTDENEEHHSHEDNVKVPEKSGGTTSPSPSLIPAPPNVRLS
jgi:hypothetical protein